VTRKENQIMKPGLAICSLGIALLCASVASTASAQGRAAPTVLPKPGQPFSDAKIGRTYKDSKPGSMALTKAPAGAPNVLIILIDQENFRTAERKAAMAME
jgi:hypothetical protein